MTTALDIITLSLKDIGVLGESETPSAEMAADSLTTLNQMLAMWQVDNLYIYAQTATTFVPTGALSYTVGTAGTVAIDRPASIDAVFYNDGTTDTRIDLMPTFEEYQAISSKTQSGSPMVAYYQPSYPLGVLYLYPQPASGTVKLLTKVKLPTYAAGADSLTIPQEFEMVVRYSLCEHLSIAMSAQLRPDIAAMAFKTRKMMKRNNLRLNELDIPAPAGFDIANGY